MSRVIDGNVFVTIFFVCFSVYFCLRYVLDFQRGNNGKGIERNKTTDLQCPIDIISCAKSDINTCCSPKYGLLVLALQWDLNYGPSEQFTIHGLWPDKCDGTFAPRNGCDSSRNVDRIDNTILKMNRTLYNEMKSLWPSNKGDDNKFWVHEWNKHGTCVTTLDPKCYDGDEYVDGMDKIDYFAKVVELTKKYNVYEYLKKHGVVPIPRESNGKPPKRRYKLADFTDAIEAEFGFKPNVFCVGARLMEVRLFFLVKNKDVYVPTYARGKSTCRSIIYQERF